MMRILLTLLLTATSSAFVVGPSRAFVKPDVVVPTNLFMSAVQSGETPPNGSSMSSSPPTMPAVDFVKNLLARLPDDDGVERLLDSSSFSWRTKIYEAVGAPPDADPKIVAKALKDAMSPTNNQFAILLGHAEEFVAVFPSDPVEYEDGTSWVECRLRDAKDDELLVTMGLQLEQRASDGAWLLSSLDWQDFRDEFYPGLSGREWLRAF